MAYQPGAEVRRTEVIVAGAGPTGSILAHELRAAGIDVVLLDALTGRAGQSRAGGIGPRTIEIFDQRGLLELLLPRTREVRVGHFAGIRMDTDDFATRYPHGLAITQNDLEDLLERRVTALGAPVRWDSPVTGLRQDTDGVEVEVGGSEPRRIRAAYLVGCDGGRGVVRAAAGIGCTGTEATMLGMLSDVEMSYPPEEFVLTRRCPLGDFSVFELEPGRFRAMVQRHDRTPERDTAPTFDEFRARFRDVAGIDYGMHSPRWISRFSDATRLADHYRAGRVLLAGDAAHIHYPAGGQGLNTGVQDAANLGWKLAAVLRGNAPDTLLDTYESERRPVGAQVLHNTRAQTALLRPGPHTDALREIFADLLATDEVRHRLGYRLTALDLRYDTTCDHPLAGHRAPDIDLTGAAPATRVHELLRAARPVLLSLDRNPPPADGWTDRLDVVEARCASAVWAIPGAGDIPAPAALLIRPDGHIAWATDESGDDRGLTEALTMWFGPRSRRHRPR
ncbi:FAD-dependent monooxygenase [Nocardia sp. NEAU-351]|uniref:FAD-dependent monooxygenase n=1 Tax=Nocardia bovistercoris TaxID=2785916 RepID=A0A931IDI6_9NOCA|nr:FAD-dependent monooxygenase [Nocardia bovistercoris]